MKNKIQISEEKRQDLILAIKAYFLKERVVSIEGLSSSLLDFIADKYAIDFYNQGVYDSYKFINERSKDLLGIIKYNGL
ncbi:hypothetical protein JT05_03740 [Desulfosporosinus sp. Tol-M]|nr:hypothetical protein JT05_03740 [Desulfosporosinus sp. Tol-M]